jgi:uncharacterized protein
VSRKAVKSINAWLIAVGAVLAFGLTGCGGGGGDGSSEQVDTVLFGTAGEGGAYYFVGQGMANAINNNTDIQATAQSTAGGTENARLVASGEMDFGLLRTVDLELTIGDGTVDVSNLKAVASGHANVTHPTVRADSGIETMEQLFAPGMSIGSGEPGSALQIDTEDLLAAHGRTLDDIDAAPLEQSEQASALQDNRIDGGVLGSGIPNPSVSEVAASVGARILPATDEFLERMRVEQPDLFPFEIPAGTYDGINEPVPAFATPVILVVRSDMPDDTMYELVKIIHENTEAIERVHAAGAEYTIDNAFRGADFYVNDLGLEFHPGAISWYEEQEVGDESLEKQ